MSEVTESSGADRARVLARGDAQVIVLADGSSGAPGGAAAADRILSEVDALCPDARGWEHPSAWIKLLEHVDGCVARDPEAGFATAVVVMTDGEQLVGASAGDAMAWLIAASGVVDLTRGQVRDARLGTGHAAIRGFGPTPHRGALLVASDGLGQLVSRHRITERVLSETPEDALRLLLEQLRLPSGGLMEDAAIVLLTRPPSP